MNYERAANNFNLTQKNMKQLLQRLMLGLAALALFTAPLNGADNPRNFTGIQGRTFLHMSYGRPVEVEPGVWIGIPSVQIAVPASFTVWSIQTRRIVARGTSDANGEFAVWLPPGKYIFVPADLDMPFGHSVATAPVQVTVTRQRATIANIFYFQDGPLSFTATSNP